MRGSVDMCLMQAKMKFKKHLPKSGRKKKREV
jgi:hypothetical protein